MQKRYTDLFQSLINKIQETEGKFDLDLDNVNGELALCEGVQHTLEKLKGGRLENTEFYENLEIKLNHDQYHFDNLKDSILMDDDREVGILWDKFHELAKSCANEDRRELAAKKIEFDPGV